MAVRHFVASARLSRGVRTQAASASASAAKENGEVEGVSADVPAASVPVSTRPPPSGGYGGGTNW